VTPSRGPGETGLGSKPPTAMYALSRDLFGIMIIRQVEFCLECSSTKTLCVVPAFYDLLRWALSKTTIRRTGYLTYLSTGTCQIRILESYCMSIERRDLVVKLKFVKNVLSTKTSKASSRLFTTFSDGGPI
jgi:hypothetical protein